MRKVYGLGSLLVLVLVLAACGSDDGSGSDDPTTTVATSNDSTAEAADAPDTTLAQNPGSGDGSSASGTGNTAVVTIGDHRYEFDVEPGALQRCDPDFFAAFWAVGFTSDESVLELLLPPPDDPNHEDPPNVRVRDKSDDLEWVANPETLLPGVEAGQSQVDSWDVEGNRVTGTATFIESNAVYAATGGNGDFPDPVVGTFEVVCAESS